MVADISLGNLIWTSLWLLTLAGFVWLFVVALRYLIRDHDLSGWAKAIWLVGLVLFPFIGPLVFLLARGSWISDSVATEGAARAQLSRGAAEQRSRESGTAL
jgi:hypothetical protein